MATITLVGIVFCIVTYGSVSTHKIVTYWGQDSRDGILQPREPFHDDLTEFCRNHKYDTIILSSPHVFSDKLNTEESSDYLPPIPSSQIEDGIKECQKNAKTILMSLDGAADENIFENDDSAKSFANKIFHLLLEGKDLEQSRPFGSAILDGVDLDVEAGGYPGYTIFVKELRRLMSTGKKEYSITASLPCSFQTSLQEASQVHFLHEIPTLIDEIYVHFFNDWCNTANLPVFFNSLQQWLDYTKKTNGPKVFIGVPGSIKSLSSPTHYRTPSQLEFIYKKVKNHPHFGGLMIWEASINRDNIIDGNHVSEYIASFMKPPTVLLETARPTTAIPETAGPTTALPETARPTTAIPETAGPTTAVPETARPTTAIPETAGPTTALPETARPTTAIPETAGPTTAVPETARPTTAIPKTEKPTTSKPGTEKPTTSKPETEKPTTSKPGTEKPTTSKPGTEKPTTAKVTTPVRLSCKGLPDGIYADPTDIHKFFMCANGRIFRHTCPPGTVFNPKHKVCDWPSSVPVMT